MLKIISFSAALLGTLLVSGCDSDSSDSSVGYGTLKVYNASGNSSDLTIQLDNISVAVLDFTEVNANQSLSIGNYDFSINRENSDGDSLILVDQTISIQDSISTFVALSGDVNQPQVVEFQYNFTDIESLELDEDEDGDEMFEFFAANFIQDDKSYDLYYASEDESIEDATYAATLTKHAFSDKIQLSQDSYVFYLTLTGESNVLFQSNPIAFSYLNTYLLAIRDNFGPSEFAIDRISTGSSTSTFVDANADTQVQFYNIENDEPAIDVFLDPSLNEPLVSELQPDTLSTEYELPKDTYLLNTILSGDWQSPLLTNRVLDLEEGSSTNVIFYNDDQGVPQALDFAQQTRPLVDRNALQIINLAEDDLAVDIYFVPSDESIGSTPYYLKSIDYAEPKSINLRQQQYEILVTMEDNSGGDRLIYQSPSMTLDDNLNYLLIIEPAAETFSGYTLNIVTESH